MSLLSFARAETSASNEEATAQGAILQLSNIRPLLRILIRGETLLAKPDAVAIEVVWIKNPEHAPVTLDVYFQSEQNKWSVGNFTLYPPDRPGTFESRITPIVAQLAASSGAQAPAVFLCIALRKPSDRDAHPDKAVLQLGIAVPQFRGAGARN